MTTIGPAGELPPKVLTRRRRLPYTHSRGGWIRGKMPGVGSANALSPQIRSRDKEAIRGFRGNVR
jgi:hypothetical protein